MSSDQAEFLWQPQPAAAAWLDALLSDFCDANPDVAWLSQRMLDETGTRLVDWIDHVGLLPSESKRDELAKLGYKPDPNCEPGDNATEVLVHSAGLFPPVLVLAETSQYERNQRLMPLLRLGIRVDSVADFLKTNQLTCLNLDEGDVDGQFRQARISQVGGVALTVVERHGWRGFDWPVDRTEEIAAALHHRKVFQRRPRDLENEVEAFKKTDKLIRAAIEDIGVDWTCDLFFQAEREYWLSRNQAARVQYERQSALGLGWANHDHHTYRSSREGFYRLIACLELMGFYCRERFYAGEQAGWGAQVLEQPNCRVVIFADVDLSPDEIAGDIAHQPLPARDELGTVGTWCRLHGEAFLAAGMHHLECQFDFDAAREQLAAAGVETMAPFTDFPHLRQAFTVGEMWRVSEQQLAKAIADGVIDESQADRFRKEGVLGSHMEILERNDGYKGFNQTGISDIILRTDPRA